MFMMIYLSFARELQEKLLQPTKINSSPLKEKVGRQTFPFGVRQILRVFLAVKLPQGGPRHQL